MEKIISLDTETTLITHDNPIPDLLFFGIIENDDFTYINHTQYDLIYKKITEMLSSDVIIVGLNLPFDFLVLAKKYDIMPLILKKYQKGQVWDLMISHKLLMNATNQNIKSNMKDQCQFWLNTEIEKGDVRTSFVKYKDSLILPDEYENYFYTDCLMNVELYKRHKEEVKRLNYTSFDNNVKEQSLNLLSLYLIQVAGMNTDQKRVDVLEKQFKKVYDDILDKCKKTGFLTISKRGDVKKEVKKIKEYIETNYNQPYLNDAGNIAVDKTNLLRYNNPFLTAISEYSTAQRNLDSRIKLLRENPLRPRFDLLMSTGRTSSSKDDDTGGGNTQNLNRNNGERECITARENCCFITFDFSKLELHAFAQYCYTNFGKSTMGDAINSGIDPHLYLASYILKLDYHVAKTMKSDPAVTNARTASKAANFGFLGGAGASTFRQIAKDGYNLELTENEAKKLKSDWMSVWAPDPESFFALIAKQQKVIGYIETPISKRRRMTDSFCAACNYPFQGGGADVALSALTAIQIECWFNEKSILYGSSVVNFIHDELVIETEIKDLDEKFYHIEKTMIEQSKKFLPNCPPAVEGTVSNCFSKKVKLIKDEQNKIKVCII